jgi:hypothetical protein
LPSPPTATTLPPSNEMAFPIIACPGLQDGRLDRRHAREPSDLRAFVSIPTVEKP